METLIIVGVLVVFIVIGVPIAHSLGAAAMMYVLIVPDIPPQVMVQRFIRGADSFEMLAIPMFVLTGSVLNVTGASERIIEFAKACVGHLRGGLAYANILDSMVFSGVSGSSSADVAGLGRIMIEAQVKAGYPPEMAAALTASTSCVGPIFPPSTPLIIFGAMAMAPMGRLMMAGYIPALVMAISMGVITYYLAKKHNYPTSGEFSWKRLAKCTVECGPVLGAPIIIIGGILTGVFTAIESGVVCTFYAILISILNKSFKLRYIKEILSEAVHTTSMIMFLLATGLAFSWVLSAERIPVLLVEWVSGISTNPTVILLMIGALYIVLGAAFSTTTNLIMTVPILLPLVESLGIDLAHFGVVTLVGLIIGDITPPVGAPMFLACKFAGVTMGQFWKANLPYFIALLVALAVIIVFPQFSLFLPSLMGR